MNYQPILFILSIHVSISLSSCPFVPLRGYFLSLVVLRGLRADVAYHC
jgi:hypothetical protein